MGNKSVWKESTPEISFSKLAGDINVDVAIIGGGITGITAAYLLSKAGKKVAVLEARKIADGATGYSTGNLYSTIGSPGLHTIESRFNEDRLKQVVESRARAVDFIEARVREYNLDCDFKRVPWSLFTEDGASQSFVEKEKEAAQKAGLSVNENVAFPTSVKFGFTVENQAQFNPFSYTLQFARSIQSSTCSIYEETKVTDVDEGDVCTVTTTHGKVTCGHIVMATHTPKGLYFVHTSLGPYREYAVAVKLNGEYPPAGVWWDMRESEHYSMRISDSSKGKVLMVLGEMHKVGQKEDSNQCFKNLEKFLRERFDVASVEFKWSAQQFKSSDGIPFIGLSTGNKKTYIATGFSADGLTYGTLASMIISDEILGKENRWSKTYDASRLTPIASAKEFVKENLNVAAELIKDWVAKEDADKFSEVLPGEGKIMEVNGKKCGVVRDPAGNLTAVSAICPHLGCIVHWNEAETSWDCPCHGSRFTFDGEVIEGPAINGLKKVEISGSNK